MYVLGLLKGSNIRLHIRTMLAKHREMHDYERIEVNGKDIIIRQLTQEGM
jgi:hypothetical protein